MMWLGQAAMQSSPSTLRRHGRVLIIDDDERVARALSYLLRARHDVEVTLDPRHVVARLLSGERFDLIFCDIVMPEMTGMEFYAAIVEQVPEQAARVVFVTGGMCSAEARDFMDRGSNTFLEKPFDRLALDAVLARYVPTQAPAPAGE
jgi:CheY-like chemotaxis protein